MVWHRLGDKPLLELIMIPFRHNWWVWTWCYRAQYLSALSLYGHYMTWFIAICKRVFQNLSQIVMNGICLWPIKSSFGFPSVSFMSCSCLKRGVRWGYKMLWNYSRFQVHGGMKTDQTEHVASQNILAYAKLNLHVGVTWGVEYSLSFMLKIGFTEHRY